MEKRLKNFLHEKEVWRLREGLGSASLGRGALSFIRARKMSSLRGVELSVCFTSNNQSDFQPS